MIMTEQLDFVDPKEVLNWSYETMCTRSIQYSIDAWDLFIREYPKAVAGHLEDEEEAALHLSKWIAAGGAIDAVSSILLHQKPSFDREKNTAQARENLRLFLQNVVDDPALRLFIAAFDKEIEAISNILHWEILNKNPESFERRSK